MKKKHTIIFALLFINNFIFAQENCILTGTVFDNDNEAISFATIIISQNGEVITGSHTDIDGKYKIPLRDGLYIVEISYIGYAKEKTEIEINANETYTYDFHLITEEEQYDFVAAYDTIKINAFEVNNIDEKLKIAIDNHIKTSKRKMIFPNKRRNFINVYISDRDYSEYELKHMDINDVRSKHKQFKDNKFFDGYYISISFFRKNSTKTGLRNCTKLFYYKHNNWDIFFGTEIDDLEFPFVVGIKNFEYIIKYKDIEPNKNGKYRWTHKKVQNFFAYGGCGHDKHYENYYTNYYIADSGITYRIIKNKYLSTKQSLNNSNTSKTKNPTIQP